MLVSVYQRAAFYAASGKVYLVAAEGCLWLIIICKGFGLIYAIGDIHGCSKALKALMAKLPLHPADQLVFLGDYIDRGPDSRGVVDFLMANQMPGWTFLRGNHEQMFLEWYTRPSPETAANWMMNGGYQTLQSYIPAIHLNDIRGEPAHIMLKAQIPTDHVAFLSATTNSLETPDYFFCHAGIDPARPLNDQDPDDLLWIRQKFIDSLRPMPKLILYGHTPVEETDLTGDRINLDTGCVYGGCLTAMSLPDKKLYQAKQS